MVASNKDGVKTASGRDENAKTIGGATRRDIIRNNARISNLKYTTAGGR